MPTDPVTPLMSTSNVTTPLHPVAMSSLSQDDLSLLAEHVQSVSSLLLTKKDDKLREKLITVCKAVIASLETPLETARKGAFLGLDHAVIRSAIQFGLFRQLTAEPEYAHTTSDLARRVNPICEPSVLSRLLRYLSEPLNLVVEIGPDRWQVTRRGRTLAEPDFASACEMYFDSVGPAFRALPRWTVSQNGIGKRESDANDDQAEARQTISADTAFQIALPDEEGFFPWIQKDPAKLGAFHRWMDALAKHQFDSQQLLDLSKWIRHAPFGTKGEDAERVAFVDVGGGKGGTCITLREKIDRGGNLPACSGRVILQDRAEVVQDLHLGGVETMAHDFFAEQPIHGARVYHFRQIFHDWPDRKCVDILCRTRKAMGSGSRVLIDEVVLPETGAHWMVTQRDLSMLVLFNTAERTREQWKDLLGQAGLQIEEICCYDEKMAACIIVAKQAYSA